MKLTAKIATMLIIALALMITAAAGCGQNKPPAPAATQSQSTETSTEAAIAQPKMCVLCMLRMDENSYSDKMNALSNGLDYLTDKGVVTWYDKDGTILESLLKKPGNVPTVYYDSLDAMVMALEKGDVQTAELTQTVAEYVISRNDKLFMRFKTDKSKADDFDKEVIDRISHGYSFMMLEDKTELRDEFNNIISDIQSDGTLDKLKKTYIDDVIAGKDPEPVAFEKTDGETIKVAITGSLPPMDYISPDGTPAGFNTALLSEIGKRLDKNIELVQVDSIGRAAALASGTVDVAFWTRSSADPTFPESEEEVSDYVKEKKRNGTDEQNALMSSMHNNKFMDILVDYDMPEGTICTAPYFADPITVVALK